MYSEAWKLGRMLIPSVRKGTSTGLEFQNLRGDSELDSGEYVVFGYKEVSGLGWV